MSKRKYSDAKMIEALGSARGVQAAAARSLGCGRDTVANYIKNRPKVGDAYESINEAEIDLAEGQLTKLVGNAEHKDHFNAVRFYLRTKGRGRGYSDRLDVNADTNLTIRVVREDRRQLNDVQDAGLMSDNAVTDGPETLSDDGKHGKTPLLTS